LHKSPFGGGFRGRAYDLPVPCLSQLVPMHRECIGKESLKQQPVILRERSDLHKSPFGGGFRGRAYVLFFKQLLSF